MKIKLYCTSSGFMKTFFLRPIRALSGFPKYLHIINILENPQDSLSVLFLCDSLSTTLLFWNPTMPKRLDLGSWNINRMLPSSHHYRGAGVTLTSFNNTLLLVLPNFNFSIATKPFLGISLQWFRFSPP